MLTPVFFRGFHTRMLWNSSWLHTSASIVTYTRHIADVLVWEHRHSRRHSKHIQVVKFASSYSQFCKHAIFRARLEFVCLKESKCTTSTGCSKRKSYRWRESWYDVQLQKWQAELHYVMLKICRCLHSARYLVLLLEKEACEKNKDMPSRLHCADDVRESTSRLAIFSSFCSPPANNNIWFVFRWNFQQPGEC